jgi:hypothetical protein
MCGCFGTFSERNAWLVVLTYTVGQFTVAGDNDIIVAAVPRTCRASPTPKVEVATREKRMWDSKACWPAVAGNISVATGEMVQHTQDELSSLDS